MWRRKSTPRSFLLDGSSAKPAGRRKEAVELEAGVSRTAPMARDGRSRAIGQRTTLVVLECERSGFPAICPGQRPQAGHPAPLPSRPPAVRFGCSFLRYCKPCLTPEMPASPGPYLFRAGQVPRFHPAWTPCRLRVAPPVTVATPGRRATPAAHAEHGPIPWVGTARRASVQDPPTYEEC